MGDWGSGLQIEEGRGGRGKGGLSTSLFFPFPYFGYSKRTTGITEISYGIYLPQTPDLGPRTGTPEVR